jgi:hypothetical protein
MLVACGKARGTADGRRDEAHSASALASAKRWPREPDDRPPPQQEHPHGSTLLGSAPPIFSPMIEMNASAASAPHI